MDLIIDEPAGYEQAASAESFSHFTDLGCPFFCKISFHRKPKRHMLFTEEKTVRIYCQLPAERDQGKLIIAEPINCQKRS